MRLEQVRLSEDATQAHRLQSLLAFKEQFIAKTEPAQVIGSSGSDLSQSIYIDKGSNSGIGAGYGGDYLRRHCGQGAARIPLDFAGAG